MSSVLRNPIFAAAGWVIAIILGVVAVSLGVQSSSIAERERELAEQVDDLEDRNEEAADKVAAVVDELQDLQIEYNNLQADREELQENFADLQAQYNKLKEKQEAKSQPQQPGAASFGDGIWQVGVDIKPGTYRSPGGGGCYWALLGSADTMDIINNGGFSANQTVTIDSPWFETSGCGEWERIGP